MEIRSKTTRGLGNRDAGEYRQGYTNGLRNGLSNGFVNGNRQRLVRKKEEKKYGKILAFFLIGMLLVSISVVLTWENGNANNIRSAKSHAMDGNFDIHKSPEAKLMGTAHSPIHINGNADFANQAANEGWTGNGTEGNPYIIEGYEIDGNGGSYCIWIENTNVYFVIRNCYVHNATGWSAPSGAGIALTNVMNGTITNNNACGNSYGIYLYFSSDNNITNNNVSGNSYGIYLHHSSITIITNNNAVGNSDTGIYLDYYSSNNNITNNNACGNYYGIYLYFSSNNNITNNNAVGNSDTGIYLYYSSDNEITNNNASDNSNYGIYLYFSSNNNIITNNNASGNSYGIYLGFYSCDNKITNNNASGNSYGIYLYLLSDNNITNNTANGNGYYGIYLYYSSNNIITYNWFCNNTNYGAYITTSSTGNIIHHNMFIANNGASKGSADNKSQAYDDSGGNSWYDNTAKEGNYWSNWDGNGWGTPNAYPIAGSAGASDIYPWGGPTSEFSALPLAILGLSLCLGFAMLRRQK